MCFLVALMYSEALFGLVEEFLQVAFVQLADIVLINLNKKDDRVTLVR